jgi:hypothetical protein
MPSASCGSIPDSHRSHPDARAAHRREYRTVQRGTQRDPQAAAIPHPERPSGPVTAIATVEGQLGESLAVRRFQAWLLTLFSMLAVLLSAVGIFGLMMQVVVRRTQEIGLRMALGGGKLP